MDFYRAQCPQDLLQAYEQTVIATFVVQSTPIDGVDSMLEVVSLGVGTKVVPADVIEADSGPRGGIIVRDCHAEVLARRGFMRYLYNQILLTRANTQSDSLISQHSILIADVSGKFVLQKSVKIHLYTSSQPCGNASIKRWAKSQQPRYRADLPSGVFPEDIHARIQVTNESRAEGQVALLVKRNRHTTILSCDLKVCDTKTESQPPSSSHTHIPVGTATVESGEGNVMTCSDKIARWNALGVQGALLSTLVHPVYLSTVTVGRKFSKVHCERALCCRLQDFQYPPGSVCGASKKQRKNQKVSATIPYVASTCNNMEISQLVAASEAEDVTRSRGPPPAYVIHHPVMLGTSVKLDEGVIYTAAPTADTANSTSNSTADAAPTSAEVGRDGEVAADGCSSTAAVTVGARFAEHRCVLVYQQCTASQRTVERTNCCSNSGSAKLVTCDEPATSAATVSAGTAAAVTYVTEVLDGRTGLLVSPDPGTAELSTGAVTQKLSSVCSANLADIFAACYNEPGGVENCGTQRYTLLKASVAAEYHNAKQYLMSDPHLFAGWIRKT